MNYLRLKSKVGIFTNILKCLFQLWHQGLWFKTDVIWQELPDFALSAYFYYILSPTESEFFQALML